MEEREIKFRAWDKTNRRMMLFDKLWKCDEYQLLGWVINNNSKMADESDYGLNWDVYNLEIMQYTGLKDSKGNPIFEGDIIEDPKGQFGKVFWQNTQARFAVNWHLNDGSYETDSSLEYGDVAGNIHETPELLK